MLRRVIVFVERILICEPARMRWKSVNGADCFVGDRRDHLDFRAGT